MSWPSTVWAWIRGPGLTRFRSLLLILLAAYTIVFVFVAFPITFAVTSKIDRLPVVTAMVLGPHEEITKRNDRVVAAALTFEYPDSKGAPVYCRVDRYVLGADLNSAATGQQLQLAVSSCAEYWRLPLSVPRTFWEWLIWYLKFGAGVVGLAVFIVIGNMPGMPSTKFTINRVS